MKIIGLLIAFVGLLALSPVFAMDRPSDEVAFYADDCSSIELVQLVNDLSNVPILYVNSDVEINGNEFGILQEIYLPARTFIEHPSINEWLIYRKGLNSDLYNNDHGLNFRILYHYLI